MSRIFVSTTKTTQPPPQVFSINGALTCKNAAFLTSFLAKHKILLNLVISNWLWWIMRVLLANQNREIFWINNNKWLLKFDQLYFCWSRMAFEWKEHSVLNLTFVVESLLVKFDQLIPGFTFETSYLPFKVIPLFCTAHPLLRVIMRHPRWRRLFPLVRKEQTRAAFAELKLLFAIPPQIGWQLPGLQFTNKEMKKKNVCDPEVCSGVSLCGLRVVELNLKMSWLRLWMGLWILWDSSRALPQCLA